MYDTMEKLEESHQQLMALHDEQKEEKRERGR